MDRVKLGQMDLEEVAGRGGMAEVYRATTASGETVAVKVMRAELVEVRRKRDAFFREIRSVARLWHPRIVRVKGLGQVTAGDALASGDLLVAGAPYLVMEHVTGGTLPRSPDRYDWPTLKRLLTDLLDALAHAHAAGVIHRDIKDSNILLRVQGDIRTVKLADFGIARVVDRDEPPAEERVTGTPSMMAPEQIEGRWRDEGPWTDLYALGVLAWRIACGKPPFAGTMHEVLRGHLTAAPPEFEPVLDVPPEFEAWLRRLLAKRPRDRFRFAADAAHRLSNLSVDRHASYVAPTPPTWQRRPEPEQSSSAPIGLELFALRGAPLVGRIEERDRLWSAVGAATRSDRSSLTWLSGERGLGKTRLTDWLQRRAREIGSCHVFRAQFSEYPEAADGFAAMLQRYLRTAGLEHPEVGDRIASLQEELEVPDDRAAGDRIVLVDLLRPHGGVGLRNRSEREVFLAVIRLLEQLARERPVIVCLEDVHWSERAVRFIELARQRRGSGLALFATLEHGRDTADVEDRLRRLSAASEVRLQPLSDEHVGALVRSIVAMPPDVLDQLVTAAGGNPRLAIERMIAWAHGGTVESSDPGSVTTLSVASVWGRAIDRVCGGFGARADDVRLLIGLAALLGTSVELDDWRAAAAHLGLELPPSLVEALVFEGLLVQRNDALHFRTHDSARVIRELVQSTPQWRSMNAACAAILHARHRHSIDPRQLLRIARHAVEAQDWDLAFATMEQAGLRTQNVVPEEARAVYELRAEALRRLDAPADHEQFLWNEALQASLAVHRGDVGAAIEILEGVANDAASKGYQRLFAHVCRNLAVLLAPRDPVRSARLYDQSIETYDAIGDRQLQGVTLCNSVNLFAIMGQLSEARARLERAHQVLDDDTSSEAPIELIYQEGQLARLEGKLESARWRFEKSARLASDAGWSARAALAWSDAADVTRMLGDLEHAEQVFRRVLGLARAMGQTQNVATISMNLSLIASQRGDFEGAWELAQQVRELGLQGAVTHFVAAIALPAAAGTGRFEQLDEALSLCEELSVAYGVTDWDLAWTAREAGRLAADAGRISAALRAYRLAFDQLNALGSEDVESVRTEIARLEAIS